MDKKVQEKKKRKKKRISCMFGFLIVFIGIVAMFLSELFIWSFMEMDRRQMERFYN